MACRCGRPAACVRKLTFTAWINQCLLEAGLRVQDLEKDLDDGLVLLKLIETLSPGNRIPGRYYASPKSQIQKIQNLTLVFRYLAEVEKIPLNGITAGDVLDRNTDKTLELLWLLILHYHIDCRSQQHSSEPALNRKNMCKQSMLVWVNAVLPGKHITNFTSDWSNGENLVALINFCRPGLVSPLDKGANPYEWLSKAMQTAQKAFNVPPVLSPDDLFVDQPDEVSVMTYLSYFCRSKSPGERALLQWVQQQIPGQNVSNLTTNWVSGVTLGALVHRLTGNGFPQCENFSSATPLANTRESMKKAEELLKIPPSVSADSLSSDDLGYLAKLAYLVQFYAAHKGEPVVMRVDISKVQVSPVNRGEEKGSKVVWIDVDCSEAGTAEIKASVSTEAGKEVDVSVTTVGDGEEHYRVKFVVEEGVQVYTVSIIYGGQEVKGSPFHVNLADADATMVQPLGIEEPTEWEECKEVVLGFDTREAGYGKLTAKASGESAGSVPVRLVPKPRGGFDIVFVPPIPDVYLVDVEWGKFMALAKGHSCGTVPIDFQQDSRRDFKLAFEPPSPDVYTVDVTWGGEPVPGSPFTINLLPPATPENVDTGDPMFGGVGENVVLPVDLTHAGSGVLTATCSGEKVGKVETTILTISKKLYQVSFFPSQVDVYNLSVFFNDFHVRGSPFRIDLSRKVCGDPVPQPTVQKEIGSSMVIEVPSRDSHNKKAKISVTVSGDRTGPCGTVVKKNSRGNYEVTLNPRFPDIYTVEIQLNDVPVPECCFVVRYVSRSVPGVERCQLLVDMTELQKIIDVNTEVQLAVNTSEAGSGSLEARVEAPDGKKYDVSVKPREDEECLYDIIYVPKVAGIHYLKITWDGKDIPNTPLQIRVTDFAKVVNFGHGRSVSVDINVPNNVKESDIKAHVVHIGSGGIIKYTGRYSRGKYHISFSPKLSGLYSITVLVKGREIPGGLHVVRSGDIPNAQKCVVKEYPGNAFVGHEMTFKVDARSAGSGELHVKTTTHSITLRKSKSKATWKEAEDEPGVYIVTFTPTTTGQHSFHITWAGRHIPSSPRSITVLEKPVVEYRNKPTAEVHIMDLLAGTHSKVDPIPEEINCCIGQALLLRIKTSFKNEGILAQIGKGLRGIFSDELKVTANGERTGLTHLNVRKSSDDYYVVEFAPTEKDRYVVYIEYENEEVINSPITVVFDYPKTDHSKVEIVELIGIECFIDQEFKFEVKTTGAGVGPLQVLTQAPGDKGRVPVRFKEEKSDKFIVRYHPRTAGKHFLHLLWGEIAIPRSPLEIVVNELPVVPPGQPVVQEIPSGRWKLSEIDSIGTHLDTGKNYKVKRKHKRGKYVFSLQPDEPGTYEIALRVEGKDICRPFRFKYERPSRPDKVVVFDFKGKAIVDTDIKFKIDVSEAGTGSLKIQMLEGPGQTTTEIISFKDGIYTISFSAASPGKYLLRIMWGEVQINGNPFSITVINTDDGNDSDSVDSRDGKTPEPNPGICKTLINDGGHTHGGEKQPDPKQKVKEVGTLKSTQIKTIKRPWCWVEDLTEREGKLKVTAVGDKTGPAEVLLTQVEERVYQVTFRPTKSDRYTISILLNGEHISDSPRVINYEVPETNINRIKVDGWGKIISPTAVGQTVQFLVDTQDAGLGELKVRPKTPKSHTETHTIEIDEHSGRPGVYTVSYTPLIVGVHSLELLFSQIPVPGGPLQLIVCDPQSVVFNFATGTMLKISQSIKIEVDTSKAGSDQLTATCEGTNCGQVSVSITPTKVKGKFAISFKPLVEDLYTLVVKLGSYHIKGSPFKFNLTSIPIEKAIVTGPHMPEGPGGPIKLTVNTADLPRGKLESYCKFNEQTVSVQVKEESPNVFSLIFHPEEPAVYVWTVLFQGQHVPGSPFTIDTRPRPNKAVVVVPETGSARICRYMYYEVDMSGAGMGTLTATCRAEKSKKKIPVNITLVRQSVYRISFLPLTFDTYTLYIQWSGKEIPNSPFVFELKPHEVEKLDIPFIIPASLEDTSALQVTCTGLIYGVIAVKLIPVTANSYSISFKSKGADIYTVNVLYNGDHVRGSPILIDLKDAKIATRKGDIFVPDRPPGKVYEMTIGTAIVVRIRQKGKHQAYSELKATAVGEKTGNSKIHVEKYSSESYQVTFNPKIPDTYTINIGLNGESVPQCPIIAHYSDPPTDPSMVTIIGLEDILSVLDINKEVSLVINATRGGNGTFRAEVSGPKQARVDVQPRDGEPGTYTISFRPTAAGLYTLSLFWNEEHIPNSPLKIRVVDTSTAIRVLPGKRVTTGDTEIKYGPTDIQAYALARDSTNKLTVTVKQIKTHLYRFIFSHKQPGLYFIHILVNGKELDVSPIPVYITELSWPRKCRVHNLSTVGYMNEEISMVIDCSEGGEGTLEAKVIKPNKSEKYLEVVGKENGAFSITYTPTAEGTYTFHISWSGQAIAGSPYQLTVRKPTQEELPVGEVTVIDLTDKSHPFTGGNISMNCFFMFSIRLTKKQARSFTARAISKDGKHYAFSLVTYVENLYKYSFRPPTPGQYTLEFSLGDLKLKLPQLPSVVFFTEAEVDARKLRILKHTISGLLLIDRQIFFQVDTRLAGNGKITAKVEGPSIDEADFHIVPTPNTQYFYDVSFTPTVAGFYQLELLWDGTMVPSFPLLLHVVEPKIRHGEPALFPVPIDSPAKDITSFAIHVETGERVGVEIHQVSKRRYEFEFHPKISGKYDLHVLVGGNDIRGSPFQLIYGQPPQPQNVTVTHYSKTARVDSEVKLIINTQRAGDGDLGIKVAGPESIDLQLTEIAESMFKATFIPHTRGLYTVQVVWCDEHVPNSPFEINILEKGEIFKGGIEDFLPNSPKVIESGVVHELPPFCPEIMKQDLAIFGKSYTIGRQFTFRIIHGGFPEKLNVKFSGPADLQFKVTNGQGANKYEVDPKVGGRYEMVILWDGSVVSDVYTLSFELPKTIGGFNLRDQMFQVGRSYQFVITTDDISPGAMEISCEPRDAADIVCTAVTSTQYQCSLVPKKIGDVKIAVSYNGFQIQGSPFLVHFKAATAFNCKFSLQSEGIEINNVSAELESIATQQAIPISLQQLFGGECHLDFVPTDGDEYKLTITCGLKIKREKMAGSPFSLTYLAGEGDASMCRMEGGISGGVVGEWSKFVVNCEGAGSGKLTAKISGGSGEVKVVSLSEYKYEVHYRISAGGEYQLRLMWGGQDIPGSPFNISIESTVSLSGFTLSIPGEVFHPNDIDIDCEVELESSEDLTFEATTESGKKISGTLTKTEKGFHVRIPTSELGHYSVAVYYQGKPVLPKPSIIEVVHQFVCRDPVPLVVHPVMPPVEPVARSLPAQHRAVAPVAFQMRIGAREKSVQD